MLTNGSYYWGTIRKSIIAFGNMFNNIEIERKNASGNVVHSIKVPLAYAPRQKFLARIDQAPDSDTRNVQITLPRMSFEIVKVSYDPTRKLASTQKNRTVTVSNNIVTSQFVPVPYNIQLNLYVYVKNSDDGLQIIEQILPYFNPDYNLTIKAVPDMNINHDIPIVLDNIDFTDSYDGSFNDRRAIIWTLSFTLKTNFFGPTSKQGVIRRTQTSVYSDPAMGNLIGTVTVTTSPANAQPANVITYVETFEGFD
jgi:hypothetical protein